MSDTIFAQSSAKGKAGVAVFRISGNKSLSILQMLCNKSDIITRKAYYVTVRSPTTSQIIDYGLAIYFQGEKSFTGEDIVEIHCHGSIAVCKILTECLLDMDGVRLAEPGEFAKRAVLNGKMDLTRAEGISDLIMAETAMQHKQAIKQSSGELEILYSSWRNKLIKIASLVEAYIDFPDEDISESTVESTQIIIRELLQEITIHLSDPRKGERLRDGIKLAIIGEVNVGKSSLMNYLMMRDVAITSNIAGTTRDIIEGYLDIGGYPIIICDTAGFRKTDNIIEKQGIKRSLQVAEIADIKLIMFDASNLNSLDNFNDLDIQKLSVDNSILVVNKIDLSNIDNSIVKEKFIGNYDIIQISLHQKIGLTELMQAIVNKAETLAKPGESPLITRVRYRKLLERASTTLKKCNFADDLVLTAENIRIAIRSIESIIGKMSVDDILDEIFANFCIGK